MMKQMEMKISFPHGPTHVFLPCTKKVAETWGGGAPESWVMGQFWTFQCSMGHGSWVFLESEKAPPLCNHPLVRMLDPLREGGSTPGCVWLGGGVLNSTTPVIW